jgi:hypothetical protein
MMIFRLDHHCSASAGSIATGWQQQSQNQQVHRNPFHSHGGKQVFIQRFMRELSITATAKAIKVTFSCVLINEAAEGKFPRGMIIESLAAMKAVCQ